MATPVRSSDYVHHSNSSSRNHWSFCDIFLCIASSISLLLSIVFRSFFLKPTSIIFSLVSWSSMTLVTLLYLVFSCLIQVISSSFSEVFFMLQISDVNLIPEQSPCLLSWCTGKDACIVPLGSMNPLIGFSIFPLPTCKSSQSWINCISVLSVFSRSIFKVSSILLRILFLSLKYSPLIFCLISPISSFITFSELIFF